MVIGAVPETQRRLGKLPRTTNMSENTIEDQFRGCAQIQPPEQRFACYVPLVKEAAADPQGGSKASRMLDQMLREIVAEPGWWYAAGLAFFVIDYCKVEQVRELRFGPRVASALRERMPAVSTNLHSIVVGRLDMGQSIYFNGAALDADGQVFSDVFAGRITEADVRRILG